MNDSQQSDANSVDIETTLAEIDETRSIPNWIQDEPGVFLRLLFDKWHLNGGVEAGKYPRNSIRKMSNDWLTDDRQIKSLHPKLTGKTRLTIGDMKNLLDLMLLKWKYVGDELEGNEASADGYLPFPSKDTAGLRRFIVLSIFPKNDYLLMRPKKEEIQKKRDVYNALEVFFENQYKTSRGIITISRNRTVIGPSAHDNMRAFWYLMSQYYQYDHDNTDANNILIWLVDFGTRRFEDEDAFLRYQSLSFLINCMLTFAHFESIEDIRDVDRVNRYREIKAVGSKERLERWRWIKNKCIFIAENLREEEKAYIQEQDEKTIRSIKLKRMRIGEEQIYPQRIPEKWSRQLRGFYGRSFKTMDNATITASIHKSTVKSLQEPGMVSYSAHSRMVPEPGGHEEDIVVHTIDLVTPGADYDEAMIMAYHAARCRQRKTTVDTVGDEEIALAYMRYLGYELLRVEDMIRLFTGIEND